MRTVYAKALEKIMGMQLFMKMKILPLMLSSYNKNQIYHIEF